MKSTKTILILLHSNDSNARQAPLPVGHTYPVRPNRKWLNHLTSNRKPRSESFCIMETLFYFPLTNRTTTLSTHHWSSPAHFTFTSSRRASHQTSIMALFLNPLNYKDKEEYIFLPSCELERQVVIIVTLPKQGKFSIYCTWNRKESCKCTSGMDQQRKQTLCSVSSSWNA